MTPWTREARWRCGLRRRSRSGGSVPGPRLPYPPLVQAQKDDSPQVRQAASVGLKRIKGAPESRAGRSVGRTTQSVTRSHFWSKAYLWRSSCRRRVAE
jgi:hypothetical protein